MLKFWFVFLVCGFLSVQVFAKDAPLRAAMSAIPNSTDPVYVTSQANSNIVGQIFEPLYTYDENGKNVFGQAKSLEISDDNKTYTYTLRDDIFWSDGEPVVAEDFIQAWRRLADPNVNALSKPHYLLSRIENALEIVNGSMPPETLGVKALDNKTLEIKLTTETPFFPQILSHKAFAPIPWHLVKDNPDSWSLERPQVGNGAFELLKNIEPTLPDFSTSYVFRKNQFYYNKDKVNFDNMLISTFSDNGNVDITALFINQEIDVVFDYKPTSRSWVESVNTAQLLNSGLSHTLYITLNVEDPVLKDKRVREALALSLDVFGMISRLTKKEAARASISFAPPSQVVGWAPKMPSRFEMSEEERIAKAKLLLKEAGYTEENPLTLRFSTTKLPFARAVVEEWSKIGVRTEIIEGEAKNYFANLEAGKFQLARAGWAHDYDDPSSYLDNLKSDNPNNFSNWKNEEYDALIERSYLETNPAERLKVFQELEDIIAKEYPIIPVEHSSIITLVRKGIMGVTYSNTSDVSFIFARDVTPPNVENK